MARGGNFPNAHIIASGGISSVFQIDSGIVVKVPDSDEFARQQFLNEIEIYKTFSQQKSCAFIVKCFYLSNEAIFLENMRGNAPGPIATLNFLLTLRTDGSLASRIQQNYIFDRKAYLVRQVNKLEPLHLRLLWMNEVTQAVAFLESLNLAHGDLRPDNILLDNNQLKVTDFDNTAPFGTPFMTCLEPWGRELQAQEKDSDVPGGAGLLGPRTEQFALGSIYYYINYGMSVYGDEALTDDPYDRGLKLRDLLQAMKFPTLSGDEMIDEFIHKCWHNQFSTIASLAKATKQLFDTRIGAKEKVTKEAPSIEQSKHREKSAEAICRRLEENGLLGFLRSSQLS